MPRMTVGEIVDLVEGKFTGDRSRVLRAVRSLADAGPEELSFLANPKYERLLGSTRAGAILVDESLPGGAATWIRVRDPYYAFARVMQRWFSEIPRPEGISPHAAIAPTATIGAGVRIGAFVTVSDRAVIGDRVTLFDGVYVGADAVIGEDTFVYPNVTIYHRCVVGRRCILHAGVVLGGDGYGFATFEGVHHKIPQIGIVRIENDVEVGAGTTIDRAAFGETVVGDGTKIDNLVQIAHNVKIGKHCLIVAQVGIAGSTEIGDSCVFGGQSGAGAHLRIGSHVLVGGKSAVMKNWEGPVKLAGFPARLLREHLRTEALIRRLPEIVERLELLEKTLGIDPVPRESDSVESDRPTRAPRRKDKPKREPC
ncbi:MAG TPA: UDP-3-O-(3-hydroxymyristoyl)glucosamine N-acyltransferase [Thermoanaerobaculia bacterium]